jgi:hypothetical protein
LRLNPEGKKVGSKTPHPNLGVVLRTTEWHSTHQGLLLDGTEEEKASTGFTSSELLIDISPNLFPRSPCLGILLEILKALTNDIEVPVRCRHCFGGRNNLFPETLNIFDLLGNGEFFKSWWRAEGSLWHCEIPKMRN